MTQRGQNVRIDLAGKDHFCHLQGGGRRLRAAFDNCLLHAHQPARSLSCLPLAVHTHKRMPTLVHQGEFFSQRDQPRVIFSDFA